MNGKKFNIITRLIFLCVFLFTENIFAQSPRRIEIIQAGSLEGSKINGREVRRLVGDVIFQQEDTRLYCDSALFYEEGNSIDAYGSVRIEGPRAKLSGDVLHYEGNRKQAVMTGQVVKMTDGKAVLTTTALNYDLQNEIGEYSTGGKVEDKDNVLTSRKGYYYSKDRTVSFRDNVVLTNPKYIMRSDTLRYHTPTSTAYFLGPCTITSTGSDSSFIYCEYGWYNTETEKSYFSKNTFIRSKENILSGDSLLYDRTAGRGRAWNNVMIVDTLQKMIISGNFAFLDEKKGTSYVTGNGMLIKAFTTDSMFLHADTLFAKQDSAKGNKEYYAYNHVRIFKPDLQGQCDSLIYKTVDSTVYFYGSPILWNNQNQLTAELITLTLVDNRLNTMNLFNTAFITGREDSLRYNQVKGRDMTGYFNDNKLETILVKGNGQTIYYIRNSKKQLSGVNRADCSDIRITLDSSSVDKISLLNGADATLFPIKELDPRELRLKNFKWYGHLQPISKEDIFIWKGKE